MKNRRQRKPQVLRIGVQRSTQEKTGKELQDDLITEQSEQQ